MSNFIVDPYFFVPSVCEDTNSETQGGSGATGWGVSGTQILGVGMSFDAGHYLIGKEILNVTFWLRMNTSGSGDTNAHLWNGSSRTSPRATSDAVSTSAIGTGLTEIKYTFSSPATLQAGDYMTADCPDLGTSVNWISDGSAYETNTIAQEYRATTGGWQAKTFGNRFKIECEC